MIALPIIAAAALSDRQHALRVFAVLAAWSIAGVALLDITSGGWFHFYAFTVPSGHGLDDKYIRLFWTDDLVRTLWPLLIAALAGLALNKRGGKIPRLQRWAVFFAFLFSTYAMRIHWGGWLNVLMPLHAILAIFAGLALASNRAWYVGAFALLVLMQMFKLSYNPIPLIPSEQSVREGYDFLQAFQKIDGEVFAPELQFVQTRVGKKSYALGMAAYDIIRSDLKDKDYIKKEFTGLLEQAIADGQFAAVMPGRLFPGMGYQNYYRFQSHLQYPKEYVTGAINFLRTDIFVRINSVPRLPNE